MSAPPSGQAWQQPELVETFLEQRQTLLPLLEVQEDLIRRLLARHERPVRRFLDVGSGDGAMSELLLGVEPEAEAVLLDYSEPMLERAELRLGPAARRWRAIRGDLREPAWRDGLPGGDCDLAVSAFAIHHLPAERKRELFGEILGLLTAGGMFLNMDVVSIEGPLRGLFDEQMVANAIAAERRRGAGRSDAEVERDLLADDDHDQPDSLQDQLQWLRDAGFQQAEVHFKWAEGAIFGAVKPIEGSD
jgi:tRNA (cmo5U34)-methyltransferase